MDMKLQEEIFVMNICIKCLGVLLTSFLLSSCGGGGGGGGGNTTAPNNNTDTTPDVFAFDSRSDAPLSALVQSNSITVSGINAATEAAISNGAYSIDGAAFGSGSRLVENGQQIVLRQTTSSSFSTTTTATLTIGGVSADFNATTIAQDTTPDTFTFDSQSNVSIAETVESNEITVAGINSPSPISVTGGEFAINGATFTNVDSVVSNGQRVVVRQVSANNPNTTTDVALTIGGVSSTFSVTTLMDTTPPIATITFPPPQSLTEGSSIIVRGTASDDFNDISRIRVNGIDAMTSDNFATWSVTVALNPGVNVLQVETTDSELNQNAIADEASIISSPVIVSPKAISVSAANNDAILLDQNDENSSLSLIDLSTGSLKLISGRRFPNTDTPFLDPIDVVVDEDNDRAFVLDGLAIIAVDLNSGMRTLFSGNVVPGSSGDSFVNPEGMVLDSSKDRILVIDSGVNGVIAVDLSTRDRELFSGSNVPTNNNNFNTPLAIALDTANNRNRALVLDAGGSFRIIAVDLDTGERSTFFSTALSFRPAIDIVVDPVRDELLVLDEGFSSTDRGIYKISLTSAQRTFFTPNDVLLIEPTGFDIDTAHGRILVTDQFREGVVAVDLSTAETSKYLNTRTPTDNNILRSPTGLTLTNTNRLAVVQLGRTDIMSVSTINGARNCFSNCPPIINDGPSLVSPQKIATSISDNNAYVTDSGLDAVVAINLTNRSRSIVSDNATPNSEIDFDSPEGIAIDEINSFAYVIDNFFNALISVDLDNGQRTIVSDDDTPGNLVDFFNPTNISLDLNNNTAFVVDVGLPAIFSVNLGTGVRSILSDNTTPDNTNAFITPEGLVFDSSQNRLLIVDQVLDALLAVDIATGARTIISDATKPNSENSFSYPIGIELDSVNNQVLITDQDLEAVIAVDLTNGQRVILSR